MLLKSDDLIKLLNCKVKQVISLVCIFRKNASGENFIKKFSHYSILARKTYLKQEMRTPRKMAIFKYKKIVKLKKGYIQQR